jgi:hypothetical protein
MIRLKQAAISAFATGLALASAHAASAACTQADVAGRWQAYSINSVGAWVRCRLSIDGAGNIANNTCITSLNTAVGMTGGKVQLSSGFYCTFTGSFFLGGAPNTIRHSTMARDKFSVEGVGVFPGGAFNFSLTRL